MFDSLVDELSQRYGLGDRGRDLFGLLMAYIHNDRRGGFGGFVEGFREQGHGELVASWLGNPAAGGLNASEVGMVFGQGLLNDWGTRLGASRATVAAAIAGVLPRLVAELTPGGRMPGAAAAAPSPPADASRATVAEPLAAGRDNAPAWFDARPGRDGPIAGERSPGAPDSGPSVTEPASQPMRRAASPVASPSVRTPVEARHGEGDRSAPQARDPGEQRIAEIAAAFAPRRESADDAAPARRRPDYWRPAVHPPQPRRRRGWLLWLLALLALLAVAGWYAWELGLLDPYIRQLDLPIRTSQPA